MNKIKTGQKIRINRWGEGMIVEGYVVQFNSRIDEDAFIVGYFGKPDSIGFPLRSDKTLNQSLIKRLGLTHGFYDSVNNIVTEGKI